MLRLHLRARRSARAFHEHFAAQLNDTHPAIAVAELMRLLVDEHLMDWDAAWRVTQQTFAYTNHTLLAEALETVAAAAVRRAAAAAPRDHLRDQPPVPRRGAGALSERRGAGRARVADRRARAEVACGWRIWRRVGSHAINGVAALHTELLKHGVLARLLRALSRAIPQRHQRRDAATLDGRAAIRVSRGLITEAIGDGWIRDTEQELPRLEPFADDAAFRESWRRVKRANKVALAAEIQQRAGVRVDPDSMFDVQVKRIHEYKRQHLNVLHIITRYLRLLEDADECRRGRSSLRARRRPATRWRN